MTQIKNLEGLSAKELARELDHGATFVMYQYTISILVMTFRRSSDIYFIPSGESRLMKGLGFSLLSFLLGWWGIPWGPIYTIGSLITNFRGGKDVTEEVLASMHTQQQEEANRLNEEDRNRLSVV